MVGLPDELSWLPVFALDHISDLVIITDADLVRPDGPCIIYVNQAVLTTTEYGEEELIGRSPKIFQGARTDNATKARMRDNLHAGLTVQETVLNYTKSGRPYWVELHIAPLRDQKGAVAHFLSIQRNVTQQRLAREAQERDHRFVVAGERIGKIGTWSVGLEERDVLWSEGTYEIFEWDKSETPPDLDRCLELIAPDEREILADLLDRCIKLQEPFQWEVAAETVLGTSIRLVVRGEALMGEDGRTKAVVGAIRDITDEKRTVETLDLAISKTRMLERHFASARAAAKIGLFEYAIEDDLMTWSDELLDMTGLDSQLFPASAEIFLSRVDEKDRSRFESFMRRAIGHDEDFTTNLMFHRPDGRAMHMQIVAESRQIDYARRIVGIARDITEEVKAASLVVREKERFEIIADTVSDVLWDWEIEKGTWWVSPNWPQKLGLVLDGRDITPERWPDYIHESDRQKAGASLRAALKSSRGGWRSEFKVQDVDGSTVDVEVNAKILRRADGWAHRMLGNLRNITTENRRREGTTRSRALEAVGKMTGGIAHDFNNLLMIIQGNAELLADGEHNEEDRESIRLIAKASDAAADLTKRLLSFSGQVRLTTSKVDLRGLIGDLEPLLRSGLTSAVELKMSFAQDLWDVEVDAGALEQAVINLAVNARDAMMSGGTIEIACVNHVVAEEMHGANESLAVGHYVRLRVSDTGSGMSEDVLAKACEPFFTTKDVGKGTGLGLSTVYGFAKQSGGGLQIQSEIGKGTTISLYLPASKSDVTSSGSWLDGAQGSAGPSSVRILVVEDQPEVRKHVEKLLGRAGYTVAGAQDAKAALSILEHDADFDILFTDVVMPGGINGVQLAAAASKLAPKIKVLYTSGFPATAFDQIGVEHGQELVLLSKPYKSNELIGMINAMTGSA